MNFWSPKPEAQEGLPNMELEMPISFILARSLLLGPYLDSTCKYQKSHLARLRRGETGILWKFHCSDP